MIFIGSITRRPKSKSNTYFFYLCRFDWNLNSAKKSWYPRVKVMDQRCPAWRGKCGTGWQVEGGNLTPGLPGTEKPAKIRINVSGKRLSFIPIQEKAIDIDSIHRHMDTQIHGHIDTDTRYYPPAGSPSVALQPDRRKQLRQELFCNKLWSAQSKINQVNYNYDCNCSRNGSPSTHDHLNNSFAMRATLFPFRCSNRKTKQIINTNCLN